MPYNNEGCCAKTEESRLCERAKVLNDISLDIKAQADDVRTRLFGCQPINTDEDKMPASDTLDNTLGQTAAIAQRTLDILREVLKKL